MWSNGYEIPEDINALKSMAVLPDGDFVNTFGKLAAELDKEYKWLRRPFYSEKNKDVVKVVSDITKDLNGQGDKRRILNGCQAIFRNPILRGDYGRNSAKWKKQKGFDKLLMMTGQFFKAIKARFVR